MTSRIILGIGSGRCGTFSLARLLNQQPDAQVAYESPPLLPWLRPAGDRILRERFARFRRLGTAGTLGDVASFYLPYIDDAIALEPEIRIVCLKRPREEVVADFCRWLDDTYVLPTNHWAEDPIPGRHHVPDRSLIYPHYETQDRAEGIRRYWDEYYGEVERLAARCPQHLRIYDTQQALDSEEGQRDLLSFVGIPPEQQLLAVGANVSHKPVRPNRPRAKRPSNHPMDPRRCVVLVPFTGHIHAGCESALRELERRGYDVRRVGGYAAIDQGRNQMATDALVDGYQETMWIDADVEFHPDAIDQLRAHNLPIVSGIYPQKGRRALASHILPGTAKMVFGKGGGLVELLYAATGFLFVRREVYETIQCRLRLPVCNQRFGSPMVPFFHPMLHESEDGHWYLAEDYAFSQRVRQSGFKIMADSTIRLWHIGNYSYGWEDAGKDWNRSSTYTLNFSEPVKKDGVEHKPTPPDGKKPAPRAAPPEHVLQEPDRGVPPPVNYHWVTPPPDQSHS
jgi:hypothetical protein